ncbi:universal stress protein [Halorhabdus amylolytica]|uniref:universal stress protein n=1 Tax=Halorhabdus amylolytica TaxID=2559573 RepID=UPI0010A9FB37|nr:universal stress protein [Halorhabdus amylolytica]
MYQILMPIDGSESRGQAQAETVIGLPAAADQIEVSLLHVFEDEDREESTGITQIAGGSEASSRLREERVTVTEITRVGDPAEEILAAADEIDADHIVLGGRKRSPAQSLLFGSVSQEVMLDADRPVTITGGEK